ncbi:MAG: hypothetical protein J5496_04205 [Lachnospiraceae bacterium]|nr:hypothetical protein [Lachnospiraceae bacterium]
MQKKLLTIGKILLPILALLPGLGLILYYIIGPAAGHMTSDCTDSLRWAQASFLSGRLVSDNFSYAGLLPFGGNLIFWPFIALFGYGLKAQLWGLALFAVLFAAALYYFARGLKLGRTAAAGLVSVTMLILSSGSKLREIMWEHIFYYNLGILFFCVGFGLMLRILKHDRLTVIRPRDRRLYIFRLLCLGLFTVLAATDGLQTLVCYTLPLLAGLLTERFLDGDTPLLSARNRRPWLVWSLILFASALGFLLIPLVCHGVQSGYMNGYSAYTAMSKWTENFQKIFYSWAVLLGVSVKDGDYFVKLESIGQAIRIFGALFLLFFPLILLCRLSKLKSRGLKMLTVGHAALMAFILFGWVFGRLGAANWRLTPLLGTGILTTFSAAALGLQEKKTAARFGALGLAFLILLALLPAREIRKMPADSGRDNAWFTAAAELKAHDLKYGYATFWWCELVTMLSENEAQVSNMDISKEGKPVKRTYQDFLDCYKDKDTDRYFLLLMESENKSLAGWLEEQRTAGNITEEFEFATKEYTAGGYSGDKLYVYVFAENIF